MCNVYLHRLDREWDDRDGVLCRYADDLVVMCWSRSQAEAALERLTDLLAGLGLEPKAAKTRIVRLEEGGGGFDFLGFHHRLVRSRGLNGKRGTFLDVEPPSRTVETWVFEGWPGVEAVETVELREVDGMAKLTHTLAFRDQARP